MVYEEAVVSYIFSVSYVKVFTETLLKGITVFKATFKSTARAVTTRNPTKEELEVEEITLFVISIPVPDVKVFCFPIKAVSTYNF